MLEPDIQAPFPTAPYPMDIMKAFEIVGENAQRLRKLTSLMAQDMPLQFQRLQNAAEAGDGPSAALHAHTIKGQAATVCAGRLRDAAQSVEMAAKEERLDEVRGQLAALDGLIRDLIAGFDKVDWDDLAARGSGE